MTNPVVVAPLVPRAKSTKKKRPGFRPVGKKSPKVSSKGKAKDGSAFTRTASTAVASTAAKKVSIDAPITAKEIASRSKTPPAKRKQMITVGASRQQEPETKRQAIENEEFSAPATSKVSTTTATPVVPPKPAALVPTTDAFQTLASQDLAVVERLMGENPQDARLGSYCSRFKPPPRDRNVAQREARAKANDNNIGNNTGSTKTDKKKSSKAESTGAPKVQIIDGEIVLQESSLVFPGQRRSVQEVEEEFGQDVVEEDAQLAIVGASYNSFVNRKGPQHWSVAETKRFYEGLRQLGTDFCSMEAFFVNRTRKQLKRKYRVELTKHPKLVEMALDPNYRTDVDLSIFNVEVDQKAIDAAANEVPPPYEPTDVEEKKTDDIEGNNIGDTIIGTQQEIVEEDAEMDHRTAALAAASQQLQQQQQHRSQSFWPGAFEDEQELARKHELDFPEPSMEDFFHEEETTTRPGASDPPAEAADKPQNEPAAVSISLVPKKTSAKSKRPKFRSSARKKK